MELFIRMIDPCIYPLQVAALYGAVYTHCRWQHCIELRALYRAVVYTHTGGSTIRSPYSTV